MSHTDPVILALRALGETAGTAQDDDHAQTCPHCRHEQARLTEVVDLARHAGPDEHLGFRTFQHPTRLAAGYDISRTV